eukprot:2593928-Rhodomonas_salina.2
MGLRAHYAVSGTEIACARGTLQNQTQETAFLGARGGDTTRARSTPYPPTTRALRCVRVLSCAMLLCEARTELCYAAAGCAVLSYAMLLRDVRY